MKDIYRSIQTTMACLVAVLALTLAAGCATGSNSGAEKDSGPDEIVGQPPSADSEDYQFAMPETGPRDEKLVQPTGDAEGEGAITGEHLRYLRQRGPSVVLEHVETRPHHQDGRFVGFEIVAISEAAGVYAEPDLQIGDVITHVNLVRMQKPDDYMEAWETLEEASEIRIDFKRDGEDGHVLWPVE